MYRTMIREALAKLGRIGVDPAQVEAWMRLEHPTLDGLSAGQFRQEVAAACDCIDATPSSENAALALSFGL